MRKCAEAVKQSLLEAGADKAEVFQTQVTRSFMVKK